MCNSFQKISCRERKVCGDVAVTPCMERGTSHRIGFNEYSNKLIEMGFTQGMTSPCVVHHKQRNIRTYVHGDDYVSIGMEQQLEWMKKQLEQTYQIKTQMLGTGKHHQQELNILNRLVQWDDARGFVYETDPRHIEFSIQELQLENAKSASTPGHDGPVPRCISLF